MRQRCYFFLGFVLLALEGLALFQVWPERPLNLAIKAAADGYYRYRGVIHCHTLYSDGSGTFTEIAAAAQRAGLDFLITTDHNTLQPLIDGREGYYGRCLILIGEELSTPAGHLLALNVHQPISTQGTSSLTEIFKQIQAQQGFPVVAHPYHPRMPWQAWEQPPIPALEVVNADAQWRDDSPWEWVRALLTYPFMPQSALNSLIDRPDSALATWDRLLIKAPTVAIGGADAHASIRLSEGYRLAFPSYQRSFSLVQTYLLTQQPLQGNFPEDCRRLWNALTGGHAYVVFAGYGPAYGFQFTAVADKQRVSMGEQIPLTPGLVLRASIGTETSAVIQLWRNGRLISEARTGRLRYPTGTAGVYRVEVYRSRGRKFGRKISLRPWIVSNPIYVTE